MKRFEDLPVWKDGRVLTRRIYQTTRQGAFAGDRGLCDQLQRAAVSIVSNIAFFQLAAAGPVNHNCSVSPRQSPRGCRGSSGQGDAEGPDKGRRRIPDRRYSPRAPPERRGRSGGTPGPTVESGWERTTPEAGLDRAGESLSPAHFL